LQKVFESEERRKDWRTAQLCAAMYNCQPQDPKKPRQWVSPEKFMPKEYPDTQEALEAKLGLFEQAMGARVVKSSPNS